MAKVKALQLSFKKQDEASVDLLIRGVFWPFWPMRGRARVTGEQVELALPRVPEETIPKDRIEHFLLDKLGAGVFVMVVLAEIPEKKAEENPEPAGDTSVEPEEKPVKKVVKAKKGAGKEEKKEEPPLERRYLGFFSDPEDAKRLGRLVESQGYKVVAWMGNWREKVGVVTPG